MASTQITGKAYAATNGGMNVLMLSTAAVSSKEAAYTNTKGRTNNNVTRTNLGGETFLGGVVGGPEDAPLIPGIYTFGSDANIVNDII